MKKKKKKNAEKILGSGKKRKSAETQKILMSVIHMPYIPIDSFLIFFFTENQIQQVNICPPF